MASKPSMAVAAAMPRAPSWAVRTRRFISTSSLRERLGQRSASDRRAGGRRQRYFEPEPAAPAKASFNPDLATHKFDQLFGDREAQAGAAEPARDRPVGLAEFSEQLCSHLLRHTDTGVGDLEAKSGEPAAAGR